jgi:NAD(P)-dependent dehydrogenase (short-subunit alcohol dehydrogenase family)
LEGKNAIVTGAGSGIGAAVAAGLAREGAGVACADINAEAAERVAAGIRAEGGRAIGIGVDVTLSDSVQAMLDRAVAEFGSIHILHANAGVSLRAPFLEIPEELWDKVIDINLKGQFLCGQIVGRHMAQRGGGSIINTSSQLAEGVAQAGNAHYMASKGGSRMLTRAMAVDLAPLGIRVNALAPGLTHTALTRDRIEGADEASAEFRRWALGRIPMRRFGTPDDLVGAVVFLASDEARYVTGSTIVVDGGYTAH